MSTRIEDIVEEGTRVVALAEERGVPLRLVGGVAMLARGRIGTRAHDVEAESGCWEVPG